MQGKSSFQHRAQHAAPELHRARAALCRALLKVQALEHESLTEDDLDGRLLPAGLGKILEAFGSLLDMAIDDSESFGSLLHMDKWYQYCGSRPVVCSALCQVTYGHH